MLQEQQEQVRPSDKMIAWAENYGFVWNTETERFHKGSHSMSLSDALRQKEDYSEPPF